MIELNLLPDVKLEYIKAERERRLVTSISVLVTVFCVSLLVLLLAANGLQKKHLSDLSKDIASESSKLQSEPDIARILTVQNQLESLTGLHSGKPAASRLFDYLNQVTPSQVAISNYTTDMTQQTATITGTADSLHSVNQYVDTLKFTKFVEDDGSNNPTKQAPFSNVVLSSFGLSTAGEAGKPANYTITLSYDPAIFDISKKIKLSVPSITTTRSTLNATASDLFQPGPANSSTSPKGTQ
jgi:Tfp pilus assembly protein PilN